MTDLWLASIPLSRLITEAQPFLCGLLEKLLISSSITQSTHKVVTCWFGCCRSLKWCKHLCAFCSSQVAVPQLWCWMTGHNIFRTILWCHSEADLWPFGGQMTLSFYPIRHIMWVLEDKLYFDEVTASLTSDLWLPKKSILQSPREHLDPGDMLYEYSEVWGDIGVITQLASPAHQLQHALGSLGFWC